MEDLSKILEELINQRAELQAHKRFIRVILALLMRLYPGKEEDIFRAISESALNANYLSFGDHSHLDLISTKIQDETDQILMAVRTALDRR